MSNLGPLQTNGGTESTLESILADLDKFQFLAGRLLVDGSQVVQPVSGPLTDLELRATPVPVSGLVSITGPITVTGPLAVTQSGLWGCFRFKFSFVLCSNWTTH